MTQNYYEILDVSEKFTPKELKDAYRKLAMQYHPDRNPGDTTAEEKFKKINEAHATLSDPEKRSTYDFMRKFGKADDHGEDINREQRIQELMKQIDEIFEKLNTLSVTSRAFKEIFKLASSFTHKPELKTPYLMGAATIAFFMTDPKFTENLGWAQLPADLTVKAAFAIPLAWTSYLTFKHAVPYAFSAATVPTALVLGNGARRGLQAFELPREAQNIAGLGGLLSGTLAGFISSIYLIGAVNGNLERALEDPAKTYEHVENWLQETHETAQEMLERFRAEDAKPDELVP